MNALLLLAALAAANPSAYEQAENCRDGKCWAKKGPGSAPAVTGSAGAKQEKPNLKVSPAPAKTKDIKTAPPPGNVSKGGGNGGGIGGFLLDNAVPIGMAAVGAIAGGVAFGPIGILVGGLLGGLLGFALKAFVK